MKMHGYRENQKSQTQMLHGNKGAHIFYPLIQDLNYQNVRMDQVSLALGAESRKAEGKHSYWAQSLMPGSAPGIEAYPLNMLRKAACGSALGREVSRWHEQIHLHAQQDSRH
jgi:hypothetical protein